MIIRAINLFVLSSFLILLPGVSFADVDTDGDGVDDGQEIIDGTDSSDPDSYIEHTENKYCFDWNGHLSNLSQVLELRNAGCGTAAVQISMYAADGSSETLGTISLEPSTGQDLTVNSLTGFTANAYGQVCATVTSGNPDTLDAQLAYYKRSGSTFEFAFADAISFERTGEQYLTYNHSFPSGDKAERSKPVRSFVQVSNAESSSQSGNLVFYDKNGQELKSVAVNLAANGRQDVNTRENITGRTAGLIVWQPISATAKFRLTLHRYYYDSRGRLQDTVAVPALRSSGAELIAPLSTVKRLSVLELSNPLNSASAVSIFLSNAKGELITFPPTITIPAHGTTRFHLHKYLKSKRGRVTIQPSTGQAVVASVFEYGLTRKNRLKFANSGPVRFSSGSEQKGTYNNVLGGCRLRVANSTGNAQTAVVSMTRSDGTAVSIPSPLNVPANGEAELNVCSNDNQSTYGEIAITPSVTEALVAEIVRGNSNQTAEFRLPLRDRGICAASLSVTPTLSLEAGSATPGNLVVTNNGVGIIATNVRATLPASWTDVTQDSSNCASLAPSASCIIQLTPGSTVFAQADIYLQGDNTLRGTSQVSVDADNSTTLAASVSALALSVNNPGFNAALTGTPRQIIITNTGAEPATALNINYPSWPVGTTAISTCGATLAPSSTCSITITPGSVPTGTAGTVPTPGTIQVAGDNTPTLTIAVTVLDYGNIYQSGYIFAIDDTTPNTGSIGGKVAAQTDQAVAIAWDFDCPGTCTGSIAANSNTDGAANSASALAALITGWPPNAFAVGRCSLLTAGGYTDWYLPAICELGYGSSGSDPCGSAVSPTIQNMQSNLADNGIGSLVDTYWSSTQFFPSDPLHLALFNIFGTPGFQAADYKETFLYARCVRAMTS